MKQDEYTTARPDAGATEVKKLNPGGVLKTFYREHHVLVNPYNVPVSRIVSDVYATGKP